MTEPKQNEAIKYSVIFLLEDRNTDLTRFVEGMYEIFSSRPDQFEIIIIANGTGGFIKNMFWTNPVAHKIKAFEMSKAYNAVCLKSIVKECKGEFMVVCGSYQQITFESFEHLLDTDLEETDMISPWRQKRHDPSYYKLQSNIFNAVVRWITGIKIHDLSCNVKIFRREVLEQTDLYGNMYRFFPIFAIQKGFKNKEIKCEHFKEHGEPRKARAGFYYLSVYLSRVIDIFTIYFNTSFTKKPLRFFSTIGIVSVMVSLLINLIILAQKMFFGYPVGDRSLLILAIFLLVVGVQSAGVGLLGEIIAFTHGRHKKDYIIDKII